MDATNSIMTSIKKLLGIAEEYTEFDADILMHINTALFVLTQLGIGPPEGFAIEDDTALWSDIITSEASTKLEAIKSYVYMKVRIIFDPPNAGPMLQALERQILEYEVRLQVAADPPPEKERTKRHDPD